MTEKIRVLRILEYVGDRKDIEEILARSIHGQRIVREPRLTSKYGVIINAATIGLFPEIMESKNEHE